MLQAVFIQKNTTEGARRTVRLLPMTYFDSVLEVIVKKNCIEVVDILLHYYPQCYYIAEYFYRCGHTYLQD